MDKKNKEIDALNEKSWNMNSLLSAESLDLSRQTLKESLSLGYQKGEADALLNIGRRLYYTKGLSEAFEFINEALNKYTIIDDPLGQCMAYNALGMCCNMQNRLDKAIEHYNLSLSFAKENHFENREIIALSNLGDICLQIGNPYEALSYLIPAYDKRKTRTVNNETANCLRLTGMAFLQLYNYVLAEEFTDLAYAMSQQLNDLTSIGDCLGALSDIALETGENGKAEAFALHGLEYAKKIGNKIQIAKLTLSLAAAYITMAKPQEAINCLKEVKVLCADSNLKNKIPRVHELLAQAYEDLGDHKKALEQFKHFYNLKMQAQHEASAQSLKFARYEAELINTRQLNEIMEQKNKELSEKSKELEVSNHRLKSISTIGSLVTASLDFKTVINTIHKNLKSIMPTDVFGIALYEKNQNKLVYKHFYDEGIYRTNWNVAVDSNTSFTAWCFRNQKTVFINDYDNEYQTVLPGHATTRGRSSDAVICMPLSIEDRTIGVMTIQSYTKNVYDKKILVFLEALSPFIAIAVENSIIHDRVEVLNRALTDEKRRLERATLKISHLANHDSLTGLPNRRMLFELAEKAIEVSKRSGDKVGLMFIDLDNFKPINDEMGHNAGDSALVAVAERLQQLVRTSDIVSRMGGDEFVIILTNIKSHGDIEVVAKKILKEFEKPLSFSECTKAINMSMGISVYPENGNTVDELIIKADSVMYRIKHSIKNSYAFA
ncbi:hypothetical protein MASR2M29_20710 [Spirochaetota bacterium]